MTTPRLNYVQCSSPSGIHRMAYWEWGNTDNDKVLICAHGLNRTGRDFDRLAKALSDEWRVICPDVVGRGASDRLLDPKHYHNLQYAQDMITLITHLQPKQLDWIGTSMGGLIGLIVNYWLGSAQRELQQNSMGVWYGESLPSEQGLNFSHLVLNDIGPKIHYEGLARIASYTGIEVVFESFEKAVKACKLYSKSFGPLDDEQWEDFARCSYREKDGKWYSQYDLRLSEAFLDFMQDKALQKFADEYMWQAWLQVSCPTLVLHGALSDILTKELVNEMIQSNTHASVVTYPETGHAPMLMSVEQIETIREFLSH